MQKLPTIRNGFSMVELSIVLVILGLLTAGILAGTTLIRQAEMRAVAMEVDKHISEIKTFYQKYGYYPGDMPKATDFWQDATNCPAGQTPTGCNGNGDQRISDNILNSAAENAEKYRAWQHLVFAGMTEGRFTGVKVSGSNDGGDSTNSPSSAKEGGLYYIVWDNFYGHFSAPVNMVCFGSVLDDEAPAAPVWSPRDAYQMDNKLDNGLPYAGMMVSNATSDDGDCVTSSAYNLLFEDKACRSCFSLDIANINEN